MSNYFEVLGVAESAPPEVIKAAYQALAKRYHPDRAGADGHEKMAEINRAYEVLSDSMARQAYLDAMLTVPNVNGTKRYGLTQDVWDAWTIGAETFPECDRRLRTLEPLGSDVVAQFIREVVQRKTFHSCFDSYYSARITFLRSNFSNNHTLQTIGERLLVSGQRDTALKLSKRVEVLGNSQRAIEACLREFCTPEEQKRFAGDEKKSFGLVVALVAGTLIFWALFFWVAMLEQRS